MPIPGQAASVTLSATAAPTPTPDPASKQATQAHLNAVWAAERALQEEYSAVAAKLPQGQVVLEYPGSPLALQNVGGKLLQCEVVYLNDFKPGGSQP